MTYTVEEVAERLKTSKKTIYREIRSGNFQVSYLGARLIRISEEQIEKYLRSNAARGRA